MSAGGQEPLQPRGWLAVAAGALEAGSWRFILHPEDPIESLLEGDPPDAAALGVVVRLVATSMREQTIGDVAAAERVLGDAARILPRPLRRPTRTGACCTARLTAQPRGATGTVYLAWRISRVVWREQAELRDVRFRMGRQGSPRDALIEACIERLGWVEWDPGTWLGRSAARAATGGLTSVDRGRTTLCERASRLRRLATPTAGDVSQSVWQDIGAYPGLHEAALVRLAGRNVSPWRGVEQMSDSVPVRLGRLRAWQYARQWHADSAHAGNAGLQMRR